MSNTRYKGGDSSVANSESSMLRLVFSWALVSIPLLWGVTQTFQKALALFK